MSGILTPAEPYNNMFKVSLSVREGLVEDVLCDALDHGSTYWMESYEVVTPPGEKEWDTYPEKAVLKGEGYGIVITLPSDDAVDGKTTFFLNRDAVTRGLEALANGEAHQIRTLAEMLGDLGDYDANTCDVFLQNCLFGKTVFG